MLQLTAAYAALAAISALALTAWGIPWYALGYLWISVSGITVFFFAFAFERKRPKTFIWVILGGRNAAYAARCCYRRTAAQHAPT